MGVLGQPHHPGSKAEAGCLGGSRVKALLVFLPRTHTQVAVGCSQRPTDRSAAGRSWGPRSHPLREPTPQRLLARLVAGCRLGSWAWATARHLGRGLPCLPPLWTQGSWPEALALLIQSFPAHLPDDFSPSTVVPCGRAVLAEGWKWPSRTMVRGCSGAMRLQKKIQKGLRTLERRRLQREAQRQNTTHNGACRGR